MTSPHRRHLLTSLASASLIGAFPAIARAAALPARRLSGSVMDIAHVVILTQENRAFDHYFGTLGGVQGYADRFAAPAPDIKGRTNQTVMVQPSASREGHLIAPFHADTQKAFKLMRMEGTPHTFTDAQAAWDDGRLSDWPAAKRDHAMAYFTREDIPFQYALAEAFTLCDAYHCALHAGTDPNRLFLFTGTNDPLSTGHGPVVFNAYDTLNGDEKGHGGYEWTTYAERLQAAGVNWQVYQVMGDNFDDNSLVGFKSFRKANKSEDHPLKQRGLTTRDLEALKIDVMADKLPQISYIVAPDKYSEHPGPSSPAQGADYIARVLEALTSNPEVWAKTALLINFDENDGLFDHVPPPAPPSRGSDGVFRGASQIDTTGEYYLPGNSPYTGRAFGLGPRVPLYVVSPFSKGGYVASQVFDHTSIIRFLEARFGVMEPNISAWRRAVCGDLLSCFDFETNNGAVPAMPATREASDRAGQYLLWSKPPVPDQLEPPVQERALRPRRPTPYRIEAALQMTDGKPGLQFENLSPVAVVFHVYDRHRASEPPYRFTVKAGGKLDWALPEGEWDLFILGPNGFHRRFIGKDALWSATMTAEGLVLKAFADVALSVGDAAYGAAPVKVSLKASETRSVAMNLAASHHWYDLWIRPSEGTLGLMLRLAGHWETGKASMSDPAAFGPATLQL